MSWDALNAEEYDCEKGDGEEHHVAYENVCVLVVRFRKDKTVSTLMGVALIL